MKQFTDPPETPVYTSRFVVEKHQLITYVGHDAEDGAWQFYSKEEIDDFDKEVKLIRLDDMIGLDESLLEIADLPLGYFAVRKTKKDGWEIYKQNEEES